MVFRKESSWWNWIKTRGTYVGFSVLVAIVAWVYVHSGQRTGQKKVVKIQYLKLPSGLVFQRSPLKEFNMELSGPGYLIRSIRDEDLQYLVDLSSAQAGTRRIVIDPDELRLPLDVEASHPNPRSFSLRLEEVFSKTVPVKILFQRHPKEGFEVIRQHLSPNYISISGPRSIISKVESIEVPIDLHEKEKSFSLTTKPDPKLAETEVADEVLIEVEIGPRRELKDLEGVPVLIEGGKAGVSIDPMSAKVTLEGPQRLISTLGATLRVIVSVEGLGRGRYRLRGRVDLPEGIKLVSLEPKIFIVEVPN